MRTELGADALKAAAATRGSLAGAVFHGYHRSVYSSESYAKLCKTLGVTQSMGAVGNTADNALAESFNVTLKREVLQDAACWSDEPACRRQVFKWLTRYNTRRRHSWCGLPVSNHLRGPPGRYTSYGSCHIFGQRHRLQLPESEHTEAKHDEGASSCPDR